jgi:hypothetical protein
MVGPPGRGTQIVWKPLMVHVSLSVAQQAPRAGSSRIMLVKAGCWNVEALLLFKGFLQVLVV